jgi:thermitase
MGKEESPANPERNPVPLRRLAALGAAAALASLALATTAFGASYDSRTMIVKFRPGATSAQKAAVFAVPGVGRSLGTIGGVGANVVRISRDAAGLSAVVARLPGVAYAEPNFILRQQATPNDPLFGQEYGLNNTGQNGGRSDADIDAPEGWDLAGLGAFPTSGGVRVGIVDTGIDQTHPDLAGKTVGCATSYNGGVTIVNGVCHDDNGHGSHVSGTISANTNNGQGVAGVAFNSPLVMCKALAGPLGIGLTSDIANCINWTAGQGVKVISMSLGGGDSATLKAAVQKAYNNGNGVLLVAAAGNDGNATMNYPAGYAEVVSVAATDNRDQRASFSNANADVEVAAPGVNVESTYTGGLYMSLSGTSMATPHASGVAAVIADLNATANAATIRSKLDAAVDDLGPAGRDPQFGFGRVNLCKAAGGACAYTPGP